VHLAQLNVAKLRAPVDDPLIDDFRNNLLRINALGDASPGFVWRLQTEDGDATAIKVFDDPLVILNLTVWTSVEALKEYVYKSEHVEFLRRRREWFEPYGPSVAMWWIEEGHIPSTDEAVERWMHLRDHGPSATAFGWRDVVEPAAP
jgi:hypothetical protein